MIYQDRIFEMTGSPDGMAVWNNDFGGAGFTESENIGMLESRVLQPIFEQRLSADERRLDAEKNRIVTEVNTRDESMLNLFLMSYLSGGKPDTEEKLRQKMCVSQEELESLGRFKADRTFLEKAPKISIFRRILDSQVRGVLFVNNTYLEIVGESDDDRYGDIEIRSRLFDLRYGGTTEQLLQRYDDKVKEQIRERVCKEMEGYGKVIELLDRKINTTIDDIGEIGGRGFMRRDGKVYVYMTKGQFTITAYNLSPPRTYLFPSCKIGLEVSHTGGNYLFGSPTRILHAKSVTKGKETGTFKDIHDRDYPHPAVSASQDEYPRLCITGKRADGQRFVYPEPKVRALRKFTNRVIDILNDACYSIESGYWYINPDDGRRTTSSVYHYFRNPSPNDLFMKIMERDHKTGQ